MKNISDLSKQRYLSTRFYWVLVLSNLIWGISTGMHAEKQPTSQRLVVYRHQFQRISKQAKSSYIIGYLLPIVLSTASLVIMIVLAYKQHIQSRRVLGVNQENSRLGEQHRRLQHEHELAQENRNLHEQNTSLQNEHRNLRRRLQTAEIPVLPNQYYATTESLSHVVSLPSIHEATGCHHQQFERWLHTSDQVQHDLRHQADFIPFQCDLCNNGIPICYYAEGVALWCCTNYEAHAAQGGFHICRACVAGKENGECRRCCAYYVQVFPSEKEDLCLACVGYNHLIASYQQILDMAQLPIQLRPGERAPSSDNSAWVVKAQKIEDRYVLEDLTYKMKAFQERYVHWTDKQKWELNTFKNQLAPLPFDHKAIISELLDGDRTEVIICPFYEYSWLSNRYYRGTPPSRPQTKVVCLIQSPSNTAVSTDEAYIVLLASSFRAIGI
ncbi:MAG: cell division protein ZapB [Bacteroidota bacterium]